uniref:Uncharacterized protein n=1 Tax=Oryza meridionalis TaxID=40149 RepID=A0A0E0EMG1_9ORYZ
MQSAWNAWEHLGSSRSVSSSSNSLRHTAHSSAPLPALCAFTSAYAMVGNAPSTAGSSPLTLLDRAAANVNPPPTRPPPPPTPYPPGPPNGPPAHRRM